MPGRSQRSPRSDTCQDILSRVAKAKAGQRELQRKAAKGIRIPLRCIFQAMLAAVSGHGSSNTAINPSAQCAGASVAGATAAPSAPETELYCSKSFCDIMLPLSRTKAALSGVSPTHGDMRRHGLMRIMARPGCDIQSEPTSFRADGAPYKLGGKNPL